MRAIEALRWVNSLLSVSVKRFNFFSEHNYSEIKEEGAGALNFSFYIVQITFSCFWPLNLIDLNDGKSVLVR